LPIRCTVPNALPIEPAKLASVDTKNGGVFTPRGELRMLIIFAGYFPLDAAQPNLS
jgi:hypothetical protein